MEDLLQLSDAQLQAEFLRANQAFVDAVDLTPLEGMREEPFHSIRARLHAVIAELKRRRET